MRRGWRLAALALAALVAGCLPGPAHAMSPAEEAALERGLKSGRLSRSELVARGRSLSFFAQLKLYYYSRQLTPYLEKLEQRIRDLARVDGGDPAAVSSAYRRLAEEMARSHRRLMKSGREKPQRDWRRGLAGLIFLDNDWRARVAKRRTGEIRNPYDLVDLLDCLDARIRGLDKTPPSVPCPRRPAPKKGVPR